MASIITYLEKILDQLANLLLPKDSRVKLLETLGPIRLVEKIPGAENFDLEPNSLNAIFSYKNPLCRQAIWEIKFRANKKLIADFSLLLYDFILDEISDLNTFNNFKNIILLPVPSSKARVREKGFNQCQLIVRKLIKIDKERNQNTFTSIENLLIKKIETQHQVKVRNRKNRLENLKNTFTVQDLKYINKNISDCSFVLIDDVITTGATMTESFRALRDAGAKKIIGFALAH